MTYAVHNKYAVHNNEDRRRMLDAIGICCVEELFAVVPPSLQLPAAPLGPGLSEQETQSRLEALAGANRPMGHHSFLGGGYYNHFVPAAVRSLVGRSEFATAYTPYQPEVSQGTLQAMFEFQTTICELTGFDLSNASLYDGSSALAEAAFMGMRLTKRESLAISAGVHPEAAHTVQTYCTGPGINIHVLPLDPVQGTTCLRGTAPGPTPDSPDTSETDPLPAGTGVVLVQQPNCLGVIEDIQSLAAAAHAAGALLVVMQNPVTMGVLAPPAAQQADIAVGDLQAFGNALSFGGPSAGYVAGRPEYLRNMPGRLVSQTVDEDGRPCYVLTLQGREQHIRRARATSNICSNQALCALASTIHLCLLGPQGLVELGEVCLQRAHYLHERLCALPGVRPTVQGPFFYEFSLRLPLPAETFVHRMRSGGIDPGIPVTRLAADPGARLPLESHPEIENDLLVAVTEMNRPEDLEHYATLAKEVLEQS
ncbi:MAG: aminomethyl-transferring glycine dehydrogenase subunit GcvPA [Thermoleophilia bacterium]